MRALILFAVLILQPFLASGQEEVTRAGKEACTCLNGLDPEALSKRDLTFSTLGCISQPVDQIAAEMKKKGTWADSLTMKYLDKVRAEVLAHCPEQFDRLKKKEVTIDPTLLMFEPGAETVSTMARAVCRCMPVLKDLDRCMQKVAEANGAELEKRYPGADPMTVMMQVGMDVMFELADHCETAVAANETLAQLKKIPAIKEDCNKIIAGEYITATMLGETRTKITSNKLSEYVDGKLNAEYDLQWKGCMITLTCTTTNSSTTKMGEVSQLEVRRASPEGFIAMASFGKMKVPVNYKKVK